MLSFKKLINISGLVTLVITAIVFMMSVERVGSLWDCGEFILGAYKLQVVHPPGAGFFLLVGRMFTIVAQMLSDNPSDIAFAVNIMSGLCTAAAAMLVTWMTMLLGKMAIIGRDEEPSAGQNLVLSLGGVAAGLATAFATSIWFSAVEGEVYAMSTMFTALTMWSAIKWYHLPDTKDADRWLVFSFFVAGLSVGVHLLSILAFPMIGIMYYLKKYTNHTFKGIVLSTIGGMGLIYFVMKTIIVGMPLVWKNFELFTVNSLRLPVHSGLIPAVAVIVGLAYYLLKYFTKRNNYLGQMAVFTASLIAIAYSAVGVIVIRANADTPVNMNTPSNVMRLIPYLNREQYGERPLLMGPHYMARPYKVDREARYGLVGDQYKLVDEKFEYVYRDQDKMFFPRVAHSDRAPLYEAWRNYLMGSAEGKPDQAFNWKFFFRYQLGYMYFRYFSWNFIGKQNGNQGVFPWDTRDGNWLSGITPIDEARLHNFEKLPDHLANDPSRNKYYFLPFIFGLIGLFWHWSKSKYEFLAIMSMFIISGVGQIVFSNSPPQEPRERDYIYVGSFMTYCIWIGMGAIALFEILSKKLKVPSTGSALVAGLLVLSAPIIMGFQNFDDHDRSEHTASRDYAANFLNSLEPNAIIFTYGDNDTYPLWYAQEVENIRRDVRVVNLSLIQVDWYINKLRNKVNDSPPVKLTINADKYNGKSLNQIFIRNPGNNVINIPEAYAAINNATGDIGWNTRNFVIPIDPAKIAASNIFDLDSLPIQDIEFALSPSAEYLTKDEIAILDIVASNIYDRPVYFSVTCKNEKLMNLNDYLQMEGLGLRVIPVKSRSDRTMSIYGSGRIATDKAYDNIMNKWAWGNFDNYQTFVDRSYMAEVQAMKYAMLRTSFGYLQEGNKARAADVANKYFEAFPNFNFRYDASIIPFLGVLSQAEDLENLKKHVQILAQEAVQEAEFILSQDMDDLSSFSSDISMTSQSLRECISYAGKVNDTVFEEAIKQMVGDRDSRLAQLMGQVN